MSEWIRTSPMNSSMTAYSWITVIYNEMKVNRRGLLPTLTLSCAWRSWDVISELQSLTLLMRDAISFWGVYVFLMRELNCLHTQWFLCKWKPCETMNVKQTAKCSSVHWRPRALGSTLTTAWWGRAQRSARKYLQYNEGNANERQRKGGDISVSQKIYTALPSFDPMTSRHLHPAKDESRVMEGTSQRSQPGLWQFWHRTQCQFINTYCGFSRRKYSQSTSWLHLLSLHFDSYIKTKIRNSFSSNGLKCSLVVNR